MFKRNITIRRAEDSPELSKAIYWAEKSFGWKVKFQKLGHTFIDAEGEKHDVWRYPQVDVINAITQDVQDDDGTICDRYSGTVGRQCGGTEAIAMGALYRLFNSKEVECLYRVKVVRKLAHHFLNKIFGRQKFYEWTQEKVTKKAGQSIFIGVADSDKGRVLYDRICKFIYSNPDMNKAVEAGTIKINRFPFFSIEYYGFDTPAILHIMPPKPVYGHKSERKYDCRIFMDAAYIENDVLYSHAAQPGRIVLVSTSSGEPDSAFMQLSREPEHGFLWWCYPTFTNQHYTTELDKEFRRELSEDAYYREIHGHWFGPNEYEAMQEKE